MLSEVRVRSSSVAGPNFDFLVKLDKRGREPSGLHLENCGYSY